MLEIWINKSDWNPGITKRDEVGTFFRPGFIVITLFLPKDKLYSRSLGLFKLVFFHLWSHFFFNIHVKGGTIFRKFDQYRVWCSIFYFKLVDCILFSSPGQGQVSFCHHLASVVRRKLSHLNLLLWTKLNQTWQGWSLGGSLSNLCPTDPPCIQDGCCY